MSANPAEMASASERLGEAATRPNPLSRKIFVQGSREGICVETRIFFVRSADPIFVR